MSVKDVRDFLLKQMAELADSDMTEDQAKLAIERAKATSQAAGTYIAAVKVELDAVKLFDETGMLPGAIETPEAIERPRPQVLSFDPRRKREAA
jgi:hypothetical protein